MIKVLTSLAQSVDTKRGVHSNNISLDIALEVSFSI